MSDSGNLANVVSMYDLLSQVYCEKLTLEGQELQMETSLRNFIQDSKK